MNLAEYLRPGGMIIGKATGEGGSGIMAASLIMSFEETGGGGNETNIGISQDFGRPDTRTEETSATGMNIETTIGTNAEIEEGTIIATKTEIEEGMMIGTRTATEEGMTTGTVIATEIEMTEGMNEKEEEGEEGDRIVLPLLK